MRLVTVLVLLFTLSCSKKSSNESNNNGITKFDEIFQIHYTIDSKEISYSLPKGTNNFGYSYDGQLSAGNYYFGNGAFLKFTDTTYFMLVFGSARGNIHDKNNWTEVFDSFKQLMSPGTKTYDSIRYCLQQNFNRVEITYIDENKDIWSTTKYKFIDNYHNQKSISQNGSSFIISESKEVSIWKDINNAVIIKGTFNCILYKADSDQKRTITNGTFTLLIGAG